MDTVLSLYDDVMKSTKAVMRKTVLRCFNSQRMVITVIKTNGAGR